MQKILPDQIENLQNNLMSERHLYGSYDIIICDAFDTVAV